jgi:hypothetical protein
VLSATSQFQYGNRAHMQFKYYFQEVQIRSRQVVRIKRMNKKEASEWLQGLSPASNHYWNKSQTRRHHHFRIKRKKQKGKARARAWIDTQTTIWTRGSHESPVAIQGGNHTADTKVSDMRRRLIHSRWGWIRWKCMNPTTPIVIGTHNPPNSTSNLVTWKPRFQMNCGWYKMKKESFLTCTTNTTASKFNQRYYRKSNRAFKNWPLRKI